MLIGIPRGFFYYDYLNFIRTLFADSGIELVEGEDSSDDLYAKGSYVVVDEACLPIKMAAGQVEALLKKCDKVLVVRMASDCSGRWLCPKLLGLPELVSGAAASEGEDAACSDKLLITQPVKFNKKKQAERAFWEVCDSLGMDKSLFKRNFEKAYSYEKNIVQGKCKAHVEAAWEFVPQVPGEGEIVLPNLRRVLLLGHCYNVYDKYANRDIMSKLDELGIDVITERAVSHPEKEKAVSKLGLIKTPYWEALVRLLGATMCLKGEVDGIVYLSSFSCGPDSFIVELIRKYVNDTPLLLLKLDGQKGDAGYQTRLEAFADMIEKRQVS